jgi:UDP-glucose 4-epimerase
MTLYELRLKRRVSRSFLLNLPWQSLRELFPMQRVFVTGAAGFIGSNLCDRLLREDWEVIGWDNFSTGQEKFIEAAKKNPRFRLVTGDNLDLKLLTETMAGAGVVFHLAANADVRFGLEHPRQDLDQNTVATFNHVLQPMYQADSSSEGPFGAVAKTRAHGD